MTFKDFLSDRRAPHDAKGDFVRLAASDPNLPDSLSLAELQTYMQEQHFSYEIMGAGEELWKEYLKSENKARSA